MKDKRIKRYSVRVAALFACIFLSGCGVQDSALVFSVEESTVDENRASQAVAMQNTTSASEVKIYVYVCGAVVNPGVVELAEGSRVEAALQAAGGFAEDAQREYVNLAAKLEDGEKLYFPTISEAEALAYESYMEQAGLVNINTADVAQLMTLPGIGEARAQDIIDYREIHGAFAEKEDLKNVSGIKENMYKKLADKIVVQ